MPESKGKKKAPNRNHMVIAGAVVGLLAYLWYKRKQAVAKASSDTISTLPKGMPGGADSSTTTIGPPPPPVIDSLTAWMAHVQSWANTMGFDSATVQNALQHYSIGQCLSPAEYRIINTALGLFGQPPNAPYQGVVQCQPSTITDPLPTIGPFLGSGYGPPGFGNTPSEWAPNAAPQHPASETQVLHGVDGRCYEWIPNVQTAQAIDEVVYLEIAPGVFVPQIRGVPVQSAAQYISIPCPAPSGQT